MGVRELEPWLSVWKTATHSVSSLVSENISDACALTAPRCVSSCIGRAAWGSDCPFSDPCSGSSPRTPAGSKTPVLHANTQKFNYPARRRVPLLEAVRQRGQDRHCEHTGPRAHQVPCTLGREPHRPFSLRRADFRLSLTLLARALTTRSSPYPTG